MSLHQKVIDAIVEDDGLTRITAYFKYHQTKSYYNPLHGDMLAVLNSTIAFDTLDWIQINGIDVDIQELKLFLLLIS